MTNQLLVDLSGFVQRVAATARTGLAFSPTGHDAERYRQLVAIAAQIASRLADADQQAAADLCARWQAQVGTGFDGYVTPTAGVGGLVFNRRDELLLVRRQTGGWHYPGGFCEVGLSPAENAVKEVLEETGLRVRAQRLAAVIDTLKRGSAAGHMYIHLFYCILEGGEVCANTLEVLDAGFFPLDKLPRPLHAANEHWLDVAREFHFAGRVEPYFDTL